MALGNHLKQMLFLVLVSILSASTPAQAKGQLAVRWKLSTTGVWPPAVVGEKMVLKKGNQLTAYNVKDGQVAWKWSGDLRYGSGVMAAGKRYLYVLGTKELYLLNPADGKVAKKRAVETPNSVLYSSGSVYVSGSQGLQRFDSGATRVISSATGYSGEIRGAAGNHVAIYVQKPDSAGKTSPKRLVVVDLKQRKKAYEFKLLPTGWHRLLRMGKGQVVFIDYSQRRPDGKNSKEIYYTEADYLRAKKVKDEALHKKYPETYSNRQSDIFWVATDSSNIVFLGNHGKGNAPSSLLAYDPVHDKILWNQDDGALSTGLLLHQGTLWTGMGSHAMVYSPDEGDLLFRQKLGGRISGAPVAAGNRVLLRTRGEVYCLEVDAGRTTEATGQPPADKSLETKAKPGWRMYRDKVLGYLIQTPKSWVFDRQRMVKMGGLRMSIPFARTAAKEGRTVYLGSVHVLTWEAAGRDVDQLWQSVFNQQRQAHPGLRVTKVQRVADVGASGAGGIVATYVYRSRAGYPVQLRSLCVVSHGVAFEVRGWAGPLNPQSIWKEIEEIFDTFRPHSFRK